MTIRVLIVDDHAVLRAGLRLLLEAQPDMAVAGEAANADEAVLRAQELRPHVVLLDLSMPQGSGLLALSRIRQGAPDARFVILSMHQDPACVRAAFDGGAAAYVFKQAADSELLNAIRAVANGKVYVCSLCREALVQTVIGVHRRKQEAARPRTTRVLSGREREVLVMIAQGYTNRQVAEQLSLSVKSVESYRARLLGKLGLQTRVELHRYALASGLLRHDGLDTPGSPLPV
jgi:two-component system response regulator NreC